MTAASCSSSEVFTFEIDMRDAAADGLFDPATQIVGVRGEADPLSWGATLPANDDDGDLIYAVDIVFAAEVDYQVNYKFKIDSPGQENAGWETGRNRLVNPSETKQVARRFDEPPRAIEPTLTGDVRSLGLFESAFVPDREIFIYLPPGYAEAPTGYPVLYMHDGQNIFDASETGSEWGMDEHAEHLISTGEIDPVIIVGISNTRDRTAEYTPTTVANRLTLAKQQSEGSGAGELTGNYVATDREFSITVTTKEGALFFQPSDRSDALPSVKTGAGYSVAGTGYTIAFETDQAGVVTGMVATQRPDGGDGPVYGRMIVEELKPFIDAEFKTLSNSENTSLGGSSLGGLITMHLGLQYPDVFGQLLVVSPSTWWDESAIIKSVSDLPAKTEQRIWVDVGGREGGNMVAGAKDLYRALQSKGWTDEDSKFVLDPKAEHHERAWASRADGMLRFLYGRK